MTFIGLLIFIAAFGFIAYIISLPEVKIASPYKQILLGLLLFAVILYVLQAYHVIGPRDFGRFSR
jgi:hypothetical protein